MWETGGRSSHQQEVAIDANNSVTVNLQQGEFSLSPCPCRDPSADTSCKCYFMDSGLQSSMYQRCEGGSWKGAGGVSRTPVGDSRQKLTSYRRKQGSALEAAASFRQEGRVLGCRETSSSFRLHPGEELSTLAEVAQPDSLLFEALPQGVSQ